MFLTKNHTKLKNLMQFNIYLKNKSGLKRVCSYWTVWVFYRTWEGL